MKKKQKYECVLHSAYINRIAIEKIDGTTSSAAAGWSMLVVELKCLVVMCAPNFRNRCSVFCDVTLDNSMKLNHTQCISLVSWLSRIENFHFYKVFCGSLPTIRNIWIHVLDAQADTHIHTYAYLFIWQLKLVFSFSCSFHLTDMTVERTFRGCDETVH